MLTRYDPVFEDIVFDDPQWVKDFIAANTGGAGATPAPTQRPLQERSSSELRQLWRAGRITEDEWRGELQARGSSAQGAADEIAKQKTTGVSTAASTRGQLTASEQAAVTALQGSALPTPVPMDQVASGTAGGTAGLTAAVPQQAGSDVAAGTAEGIAGGVNNLTATAGTATPTPSPAGASGGGANALTTAQRESLTRRLAEDRAGIQAVRDSISRTMAGKTTGEAESPRMIESIRALDAYLANLDRAMAATAAGQNPGMLAGVSIDPSVMGEIGPLLAAYGLIHDPASGFIRPPEGAAERMLAIEAGKQGLGAQSLIREPSGLFRMATSNEQAQSAFETARPQNMLAGLGAFGLRPSGDPIADRELLRQAQAYRQAQTASPQVQALAEERGISPEGAAQMQWERDTGTKPSQTVTRIGNEFYDAMGMRLVTVGTAGSKPGDATTIRPTTGSTSTSNYADSDIFDDDIYAASGFTGVVNQPTTLHVAEGGQPEHVQVTPLPDPDVPVGPLSWSGAARGRARQPEAVESTDRPMPVGVAGFDQSVSMSDAQRMNLPLSMVNVPISARPAGGDGVGDREARALGIGPERLAAMRRLYPEMGDAAILRMMASGPSVPYGGNQSRDAVQGFVSMMLGSARGRRGPGVPAVTAFRQGEGWT